LERIVTTPTDPPKSFRARRPALYWSYRVARLALVAYVAVFAYLFAAQTSMIFPGRSSQGAAWARAVPSNGAELVELRTAKGDRIAALSGPALTRDGGAREDASSRPTILFFYGNGDCLAANLELVDDLRRLGANVLVADYVGYGMSGGEASEANCYATADALYDYAIARADRSRIYVAGWSLGSAVAVDLASRREVAGLAVFSAFTSMGDMARTLYPFLPGVTTLLRHRFESEAKIARVTCPILIGHGRLDRAIPFAMSERLAAAAGGPVTRFAVETDHNDFFVTGGKTVFDAIGRFVGA
jgi:pimeloyl-ACP methyl ester carboxylesterase